MARTATTAATKLSPKWGTSSGTNPEENFDEPEDLSDVAGLETQIPRGSARPTGSLLEPKPKPRLPIGVEIGKSAGGALGITVAVPIGGGPISGRGGITIGKDGAIKGASVGVGVGIGPIGGSIDVGTDQDEQGRGGCYQYVTVTVGPFSHTYGKNVCEPKPRLPVPSNPTSLPLDPLEPPSVEVPDTGVGWVFVHIKTAAFDSFGNPEKGFFTRQILSPIEERRNAAVGVAPMKLSSQYNRILPNPLMFDTLVVEKNTQLRVLDIIIYDDIGYAKGEVPRLTELARQTGSTIETGDRLPLFFWGNFKNIKNFIKINHTQVEEEIAYMPISYDYHKYIPFACIPYYGNISVPIFDQPSVPNSPPRKKMDDKCCKAIIQLLLMQHRHLGVSPVSGNEPLPLEEFAGVKAKGEVFQEEKMSFPFEVPKRWIDPVNSKRTDRITVRNLSELLFVIGAQGERLERVMGTREFLKDSQEQLRQSEIGTLKWLTQRVTGLAGNDFTYPDPNDFWFNTDDGIINEKKVEVKSIADGLRYLIESQNRLERILPVAEIKDSTIPARWVYPGKKGQLRVGNLIHLVEYMFRADDRARGFWPQTVKIKDANPAIKGDQKIELKFESQADMLREILKFLIDTEGDGDISNNFALRNAIQSCQQHQLLVQNNAMLDAIVEYLDFKVKETTTKVPMPFSPFGGHEPSLIDKVLQTFGFGNKQLPGKIDKNTEEAIESLFEGVLQNTEVKVAIIEADEKKTLNESLLELLKHASAASAAVSERVAEGALQKLVDSAGIAQAVTRFLFKRDIVESNGVGDIDQWINSAEAGYTDKPESASLRFPESDPLEPYDRPIAENPQIREIDTKDPKAD